MIQYTIPSATPTPTQTPIATATPTPTVAATNTPTLTPLATFTMDLNTGLTQALSDGTNTYIYGLGRIAQTHDTTTEYFLGDALGSVRQLTNQSGAITYARVYDPYGVVTQTSGASQTAYGYTGEFTSNNMVYLRSRMYSPGMGRFLTRDTWIGDSNRPLSFNRWMYTEGNPINNVDPSGNSIYSGICMPQVLFKYKPGGLLNMSAQRLVDLCKEFYSQGYWKDYGVPGLGKYDCDNLNKTEWSKPTSARKLFGDYICERGSSDHFEFNGDDILTRKLARSIAIHRQRMRFYSDGDIPLQEIRFEEMSEYFVEWGDLLLDSEFPIMHIMGSFKIAISSTQGNRIKFYVENRTDLASGTHFIGRFPPVGQEENPLSLEQVIQNNSVLQSQSAASVLEDKTIVSVLRPLDRRETGGMGFGNLYQTYTWTEQRICDTSLIWPFYLNSLEIGN